MGIIKKQSIQSTVFIYLGVVIGFFNSAFLMPNLLSPEQKGLFDFINSISSIFASIFTLGFPLVVLKLFPKFRNESNNHNSFILTVLAISLIGILIGTASYFLLEGQIIGENNNAKLYTGFALFFIMIFISRVIFMNFDAYNRMLYNTVLGSLLENVFIKLFVIVGLIAFAIFKFDFNLLFLFFTIGLCSAGTMMLLYFVSRHSWKLDYFTIKERFLSHKSEIYSVAFYGVLGSLGGMVVMNIDRIMLANMINLDATGIYTTAFFFGFFIVKPSIGIRKISGVIISDAWKDNNLDTIKDVYYKSCINQLVIALYLFLAIWLCIDSLYELIKPEFAAGKYVVLIIGLAQVVEMATGTNYEVIITSKYYKYNALFIVILLVVAILLNYLLIPTYGINGAAFASFIALFVNNLLRYVFLYHKFKLQPFNFRFLVILGFSGLVYLFFYFIQPIIVNPNRVVLISLVNIGIIMSILTIIFWIPIYFLKISPEINTMVDKTIKRFLK